MGSTPVVWFAAVFSKKKPDSATFTVCASWWSAVPGVPLVSVLLLATRSGLVLSPLNHWIAPATFVSAAPSWVSVSSWVR